jgi:isopentenyl-diphosphate delta-isomerase
MQRNLSPENALTGGCDCDISLYLVREARVSFCNSIDFCCAEFNIFCVRSMNEKTNGNRYLCLVDEEGRFLREEKKDICHSGDGLLHSAFLVMAFNGKKELLITRRSSQKKLWPGYWDGTVASHYYRDKDNHETVITRLQHEIGVTSKDLEYLFKFRYQAKFRGIGSENEICDVYRVKDINPVDLSVNISEISEYQFVTLAALKKEIQYNIRKYTRWFVIAIERFSISRR